MKRLDIVKLLINEGLSEKTLVNFSDEQIFELSKRMLGEDVMISKKDPQFPQKIATAKKQNKTIETYEELKGGQKKLDKNHNGKIDSQDFKILKGQKKKEVSEEKPSAGLSKEKKSEVVKASKAGKDIGKNGKGFEEIEKKAKESGADNPKAVAAAAMWKNIKRESIIEDKEKITVNPENNFEIVVIYVDSKKDNGKKHKERYNLNTTNVNKAKEMAKKMWNIEYDDSDLSISEVLTDDEYRKKHLKKENSEVKEWLTNIVESEYHPFTSKGEILSLIKSKLNK